MGEIGAAPLLTGCTRVPRAPKLASMINRQLQHIRPAGDRRAHLQSLIRGQSGHGNLIVIANREPYAHEWTSDGDAIVQRPASGLVTGIEPLLRASSGTWIGHGGGSADRAFTDEFGHLAVPPDCPEYTLRRVFVEGEAYEHYYSGFANEALWPLCHMAHTQPMFRQADWLAYQTVNESFAHAAIEEMSTDSFLLVQDYHFALVPRLVRNAAPGTVSSIFWHIPWPQSDIFGICPWKEAILDGMLGADIIGFHTRQYCLNFLESVQRYLECRVDFETLTVAYRGREVALRPYPISVEWPYQSRSRCEGASLRRQLGIAPDVHVSIGVDRADYTKGLVDRVGAIECLLEENPALHGRFVFVQLASPTRTRIPRYQQLLEELQVAVGRVNERFGTEAWRPIILQPRTFSPEEVAVYYAMANSAVVTPLHDGMNLVAKEYVASCNDEDGALVLSTFAGAARELEGALLVNPYDVQQTSQAILRAITMPAAERRARMQSMRRAIATNSIHDWAEAIVTDMRDARLRKTRFWPQRTAAPDSLLAGAVAQ
jgi:trehalose-6-phosphate synthase